MLLDEPDSHMHPSAVYDFIKILHKLVALGVQVIMTTHNPTTVNLIDEENLFHMFKDDNGKLKIEKEEKNKICNILTSNLISIESPSRTLFVEGNDAEFYNLVYKQLKSKNKLSFYYQLNIISSPNPDKKNKSSLQKFIEFLKVSEDNADSSSKKFEFVYGLVDDDGDSVCNNRKNLKNLFYLDRYSKENYVLDPVNIVLYARDTKNEKLVKAFELESKEWYLNILQLKYKDIEQKKDIIKERKSFNTDGFIK